MSEPILWALVFLVIAVDVLASALEHTRVWMRREPTHSLVLRLLGVRVMLLALALGFYDLVGQLLGVNLRTGEGMTPANFLTRRVRLARWVHRHRRACEIRVRRVYLSLKRRGVL